MCANITPASKGFGSPLLVVPADILLLKPKAGFQYITKLMSNQQEHTSDEAPRSYTEITLKLVFEFR